MYNNTFTNNGKLIPYYDKKVMVTYNPDDLETVYIFDTEYNYICSASAKLKTPFRSCNEEDYIRAGKEKRAVCQFAKKYKPKQYKNTFDLIAEYQLEELQYKEEQSPDVPVQKVATSYSSEIENTFEERQQEKAGNQSVMDAAVIGKKTTGNKSQLEKTFISALNNSNRLIIIDEADQLTFNAIQTVRNLNDKAHVGILLSGNNRIYNQIVMGARCTEFDQVRTRIFVHPKVSNTYTIEEMQNIFPNVEPKGISVLLKLAERESLRMAVKLFNAVIELGVSTKNIIKASELKLVQEQFLGEIF